MNTGVSARWGAKRSLATAVSLTLAAALVALGASPATVMAKEGNPNPGVLPIRAHAFHTTYEVLAARWWQWLWEAGLLPALDETGEYSDVGQSGKVWFLAGNFGGETVRTVTVPTGRALFFPIMTYVAWVPDDGANEEEIRAAADFYMDAVTGLECYVDGVPLRDLARYRAQSPTFALEPDYDLAVADGYWLLLAPLSAGKHVVEFSAVEGPPDNPWFWLHVKYNLTVKRECR